MKIMNYEKKCIVGVCNMCLTPENAKIDLYSVTFKEVSRDRFN